MLILNEEEEKFQYQGSRGARDQYVAHKGDGVVGGQEA